MPGEIAGLWDEGSAVISAGSEICSGDPTVAIFLPDLQEYPHAIKHRQKVTIGIFLIAIFTKNMFVSFLSGHYPVAANRTIIIPYHH